MILVKIGKDLEKDVRKEITSLIDLEKLDKHICSFNEVKIVFCFIMYYNNALLQ